MSADQLTIDHLAQSKFLRHLQSTDVHHHNPSQSSNEIESHSSMVNPCHDTSYSTSSTSSMSFSTTDRSHSPSSNESKSRPHSPKTADEQLRLIVRSRRKRDFIPNEKKDTNYWSQRLKNNMSAKKSREKRRVNDLVLETKLLELNNENQLLKAKLDMLTKKFGITDNVEEEQKMPQILNILENESSTSYNYRSPPPSNCTNESSEVHSHSDDDHDLLLSTEKISTPQIDQHSFPLKWRFKMLNMTHNE
ncbi:unnamed protein product [Didymodactylos carnosus]|uniref:BZIP domain-containing protein n=1 Tax=Didymodactylos carnosus TaxID=1234261 RepID=A0A814P877_9BILA|nr:unnamed protein product [Didymodactylos carnosus]CAF1104024.1 unnamed protein product [Didymodactylos carnosus]CAF3551874.1 unnamed protein product [Didymodactylos carnosus]CAF3868743.1 unnamed protein product [Didymodactylos carnosus]